MSDGFKIPNQIADTFCFNKDDIEQLNISGYVEYNEYINLLRQENERLRALVEWQPIESAPKDGTKILGINPHGNSSVIGWNTMEWASVTEPCWFPLSTATHWLPIPTAPQIGEK